MDYKKVLRGLGIAVLGAALTYAAEQIPGIDFGQYTAIAVAIASAAVNACREWLKTL